MCEGLCFSPLLSLIQSEMLCSHYPEDIRCLLYVLSLWFHGYFLSSLSPAQQIAASYNPDITLLSLALRMNWIELDCHFALQYNRVSAVSIQIQG